MVWGYLKTKEMSEGSERGKLLKKASEKSGLNFNLERSMKGESLIACF